MPGAALLQIGAYRTREAAAASWAALRTRYPEVTVALRDDLQEIDLGERGLWYRLRIGPFGSADAANITCNLLKAQGGDCFVVKP